MSIFNKQNWAEKFGAVKAVIAGGKKLAIDLSLVAVSAYSIYGAYFYEVNAVLRYGLIFAAALIILQGLAGFAQDLIRIANNVEPKPKRQAARALATK